MKIISQLVIACVLLCATISVKAAPVGDKEIIIQDDSLLVAFDANNGALVRMERKSTHWLIEKRAELGATFRMLVPLPNQRSNYVSGQGQPAHVEKISEHEVRIHWDKLTSDHGGVLPMKFTGIVTLNNGELTFNASLENNSNLTVETIDYPYLGDFNRPAPTSPMQVKTMWYGNLESVELFPNFGNDKGYWGTFTAMKTFDSNRSIFCLIQAPDQGMYVEMKDPYQQYLLQFTFVQNPGVEQSVNAPVPNTDEIDGHAVNLEFRTCHFVFAHPHTNINLVPVVMKCYTGDWHAGVDMYKQWRNTWFKAPHTPGWINDVHSWFQLQISSPEQDYRVKYKDIVQYGKECADNGVGAIQLVGWNEDGQDGGDPSQNTDPGLGTKEELKASIAKIQAMGVKMIMFGKLNWADKTKDWYKKELYKYAATDPYGIPYEHGGYSYYTPTQLAGINTRRRAVMDFVSPEYRNLITKEFQKLLDLGGSGWLFDENCHHGPVKYSFAADHGYTAPGYIYGGDMPLASQLRAAADKISPDFLFAGEGHMDWLMQYYSTSYFRINGGSIPVCRYLDPQAPLIVAVNGFDDREMLNLILMDRYIISYEPYNFKGHITDFKMTLDYGKKIDALRKRYKAYLWDGVFHDTLGATVSANGDHKYSVFTTSTGKRAVVLVNPVRKTVNCKVSLPNQGKLVLVSPENQDETATDGNVEVPPRSAVVVMEQ
ncbi:hypothetical protein FO440_00540 [Mucilaginibacter corticis]|uniref:DUF6259 domain-containing protein n=1 Tax=Mucilaginibacter corticis TaxID=2597670 RepID=A0A556MRX6_9SPHI|nr:DUF6259 domain-containing protein [Mucilaginibacter corticis]TSJ42714.1 hypothetical protein FO440_00540 [Mucilaginibacter corticis]